MENKKNFDIILLECAIKAIKSGYSVNLDKRPGLNKLEVYDNGELICSISIVLFGSIGEDVNAKVLRFEKIIDSICE